MPKSELIQISHTSVEQGRKALSTMDFSELGIPSISAVLDTRYRAQFKGKFLDPGSDNAEFLAEVRRIVAGLKDTTTQRAVYYALRGAHPEWRYKGEPLGQDFYEHLISWIMEKTQLMTGMTMQSIGIWPGNRGYIVGDGSIETRIRAKAPLSSRPMMGFDMVDSGVQLETNAGKVILFEKEAGLGPIVSNDFPKLVEAIFMTNQGQPTEAGLKFMRFNEDQGRKLYAIHDGDVAGMQMQLMYGMSSKNSCYMPDEFYPRLVHPLGFYPSIGEALGLPPETVKEKEEGVFNNIIALANEKMRYFPQLKRYGFGKEVNVLTQRREKWEFDSLNALGEAAPKIYIIEALRIHNDPIKYVHPAEDIKDALIDVAKQYAFEEVDSQLEKLADSVYKMQLRPQLIAALRSGLKQQIAEFDHQVEKELDIIRATPAVNFREIIKTRLLIDPTKYAIDILKKYGKEVLTANFYPRAKVNVSFSLSEISSTAAVRAAPTAAREPLTRTQLVDYIEQKIVPDQNERRKLVSRIRTALQNRFGAPSEVW